MVTVTSAEFKSNAREALNNAGLQKALAFSKPQFMARRTRAVAALPEFEHLRDIGRDIKNHALANLDFYLEAYADNVAQSGGQVHWCATADDARAAVLAICQAAGARTVTKGKSMISEELGINQHLAQNGITPVETDLGEYIIQLRQEHPSHIIAPAFHLNREDWEDCFRKMHTDLPPERVFTERRDILTEARSKLREKFLAADVGQQRHRHQRRQRRPHPDPASGAYRARLHRKMRAHTGGRNQPLAPPGSLRHRAGLLRLHHLFHWPPPAKRPRRP